MLGEYKASVVLVKPPLEFKVEMIYWDLNATLSGNIYIFFGLVDGKCC